MKKFVIAILSYFLTISLFAQVTEQSLHDYDPNALEPSRDAVELIEHSKNNLRYKVVDLTQYDYVDPKNLIPENLKQEALTFYDLNLEKIPNKDYLVVVDFKAHSSKKRQFLVDMKSGEVTPMLVTHGRNSDKDNDGYATKFSNTPDSLQSSLGFYLTAETYSGKFGYSLRLDGLSETNSKVRERAIVIHPAKYVRDNGKKIGRSWGCLAVDPKLSQAYIDKVRDGVLIFAGLSK